jgi:hypothetical protein
VSKSGNETWCNNTKPLEIHKSSDENEEEGVGVV